MTIPFIPIGIAPEPFWSGAREAAVGAKSPVDGVLGRAEVGVLAWEESEREPVLDWDGEMLAVRANGVHERKSRQRRLHRLLSGCCKVQRRLNR